MSRLEGWETTAPVHVIDDDGEYTYVDDGDGDGQRASRMLTWLVMVSCDTGAGISWMRRCNDGVSRAWDWTTICWRSSERSRAARVRDARLARYDHVIEC